MVNNGQSDTGRENQALGWVLHSGTWCVPFITAWISGLDQTQDVAMGHDKIWTHKLLYNFSHRGIEWGFFRLEKRRLLGEGKQERSRPFSEADWTWPWVPCSRWLCSVQENWVRWPWAIPSKFCCSVILGPSGLSSVAQTQDHQLLR